MRKYIFSALFALALVFVIATSALASSTIVTANLVKNGDFEAPGVPNDGFVEYSAGQTFDNWHVASGSIDLVNTGYFTAGHGKQSVDMNGSTWGTIYQDLKTQKGKSYTLSLLLAKNPVCSSGTVMHLWVALETSHKVTWKELLKYNKSSTVHDMRWLTVRLALRAEGSTSRLVFQSGTPGPCGPAIDDVLVY